MAKKGEALLKKILEEALQGGADGISVEYVREGTEVCFFRGPSGVGYVVPQKDLIPLVSELARMETRTRGRFQLPVRGQLHTISVEAYENFGEWALRLCFKRQKSAKGAMKKRKPMS
jgi:hypothetical protein